MKQIWLSDVDDFADIVASANELLSARATQSEMLMPSIMVVAFVEQEGKEFIATQLIRALVDNDNKVNLMTFGAIGEYYRDGLITVNRTANDLFVMSVKSYERIKADITFEYEATSLETVPDAQRGVAASVIMGSIIEA